MVLFDGESIMGVKQYPWSGVPPQAGDRVVMLPQGHSYIIIGTLDTVPGNDIPVGTSIEGHWTTAPLGFTLEDGGVLLRADYPALFAVLGTRYNTGGETSAQFRKPDSRGRVAVNKATSGTFGTLGGKTGAETVALTVAELAVHTHVQNSHNHTQNSHTHLNLNIAGADISWQAAGQAGTNKSGIFAGSSGSDVSIGAATATNQATTATNQNAGSGSAHNNIQPSFVFLRAVKY
jgi:Microcystin-dependent protein